jgi:hypothetical protein
VFENRVLRRIFGLRGTNGKVEKITKLGAS